ncbi:MAG: hypothetical protein J0I77_17535 [Rudaea sp.]|uniref:hypothetical protein n=1 Tax=unclassified Rudaea TaxID=2627037 RepID=UPI0010F62497|nr:MULTISPECIES: hypothetical protein [unclassified Rudaea]MBN8887531.1 hypothetical protein [Rudaea sp.]MBR0344066.1 hypothetical protein [Rudaea sp.]
MKYRVASVVRKALLLSALPFCLIASAASAGPMVTYSAYSGTYSGVHDSGAMTVFLGSNGSVLCRFNSGSSDSPLANPFVMPGVSANGATLNNGFAGTAFSCASLAGSVNFAYQLPLVGVVGTQPFPPIYAADSKPVAFSGTWFNSRGDQGNFQVSYSPSADGQSN